MIAQDGRKVFHTKGSCHCGSGCDGCEQTGHEWHMIHHDHRCWCGNYARRFIHTETVGPLWLCVAHMRYEKEFAIEAEAKATGKPVRMVTAKNGAYWLAEILPDQLGPHPEAAHLYRTRGHYVR